MKPSQRKIERIAITSVESYFDSLNDIIPEFPTNDKSKSYDGSLEIYSFSKDTEKKGHQDSKENFQFNISTQIKGTTSKRFYSTKKYSIKISDLKFYKKNGTGLIYFVVYISSDVKIKEVFYRELTPLKINELLNSTDNKKTISTNFKILPKNKIEFVSILKTFHENEIRQPSKLLNESSNIVQPKNLRALLTTNSHYMKEQLENTEIDFYAVSENNLIGTQLLPYATGKFQGFIHCNEYKITNKNSLSRILGTIYSESNHKLTLKLYSHGSIDLNANFDMANDSNISFKVNFNQKGNYIQRLDDLSFLKSIITDSFSIIHGNESPNKISNKKLKKYFDITKLLPKINDKISLLQNFKNFLDDLKIFINFDPTELTNLDGLNTLINMYDYQSNNMLDSKYDGLYTVNINKNKYILVVSNGKVTNIFTNISERKSFVQVNGKNIPVCPYILLKNDLDDYPNLDFVQMKNTFLNDKLYSAETFEIYNKYAINLIENFIKSNNNNFLEVAKTIYVKLIDLNPNDTVIKINSINVDFLLHGFLSIEDNQYLLDVLKNSNDLINKLVAAKILNMPEEIEKNFNLLTSEEQIRISESVIFKNKNNN